MAPHDSNRVSASRPTILLLTTSSRPEAPRFRLLRLSLVASSEHQVLPKPPNSKRKLSFNPSITSSARNLKEKTEVGALAEIQFDGVRAEIKLEINIPGAVAAAQIDTQSIGAEAGAVIGGRGGGVGAERMSRGVNIGLEVGVENEIETKVKGQHRRKSGGRRRVKSVERWVVLALILLS